RQPPQLSPVSSPENSHFRSLPQVAKSGSTHSPTHASPIRFGGTHLPSRQRRFGAHVLYQGVSAVHGSPSPIARRGPVLGRSAGAPGERAKPCFAVFAAERFVGGGRIRFHRRLGVVRRLGV